MHWYRIVVFEKYADFTGRARRKEYWMFCLINLLIGFCIGLFAKYLFAAKIVSGLYQLAITIPSIAVGVRRIHDHGMSGWWLLCPFYNLILLATKGEEGDNSFGPPPVSN